MKYKIPTNLSDLEFICDNDNKYNTNASLSICKTCKQDYKQCWARTIKRHILFLCNCNNAIKYEKIFACHQCKKYGLYVESPIDKNDDYEIYCPKCNTHEHLSIEKMKTILTYQYEEVNETEINEMISNIIT